MTIKTRRRRIRVCWAGIKSRQRRSRRYIYKMTPLETAIRNAATAPKQSRDLLARLAAIPAQQPQRREVTHQQERAHLIEDLIDECGEATW